MKKNIESRKVQSRARALHARSTGSRHVLDLPGNMSGRSPQAPLHEMEYLPPKVTLEVKFCAIPGLPSCFFLAIFFFNLCFQVRFLYYLGKLFGIHMAAGIGYPLDSTRDHENSQSS